MDGGMEMTNTLYYGDNLEILRKYIKDNSVDLIYLDPPFNSKANYNVIFMEENGNKPVSQIKAFSDFWHWDQEAQKTLENIMNSQEYPEKLKKLISALDTFLGRNDLFAYLVMIAIRLVELRRVLKNTGSLYLHCDPTASHYIKLVLDAIFGPKNFVNEIIWKRTTNPKGSQFKAKKYGQATDSIFLYSKSQDYKFNLSAVKKKLDPDELREKYNNTDEKGPFYAGPIVRNAGMGPRPNLVYEYKGYTPPPSGWRLSKDKLIELDKKGDLGWSKNKKPFRKLRPKNDDGEPLYNLWTDIKRLYGGSPETLGYPTQKPEALLERIITASSDEGDLVLDPFCGCGTALDAAEKLHRNWIGIDVTHIAIHVIKKRLKERYPDAKFTIIGEPNDLAGAKELALQDRFQFQLWALALINATPSEKKSGDQGIDGTLRLYYLSKKYFGIVQVKSGHVKPADIRDLKGTMKRENADFSIFITLEEPTDSMKTEAISEGYLDTAYGGDKILKIQIITIQDLLNDKKPMLPLPPANYNVAQKGKRERKQYIQKSIDENS
jgi:site-specific DNA-methyltransferase (adenine-specific)